MAFGSGYEEINWISTFGEVASTCIAFSGRGYSIYVIFVD